MSWLEEMQQDLIEFFELVLPPDAFDIKVEQEIEAYSANFCSCCDGTVEVTKYLRASYTLPVRKHRAFSLRDTTWEDFFEWVDNGKPPR